MEAKSPQEVVESFKQSLKDSVVDSQIYEKELGLKKKLFRSIWVSVKREAFREAVEHICTLQEHPHLAIISSSDIGDDLELIYHFTIYYATPLKEISLGLKVTLPKDDPKIPTITDIIPGAVFAERETQEMIGVQVVDLPDKRRLFLPDDFPEGVYPWRTDEKGPQDLLKILPGRKKK